MEAEKQKGEILILLPPFFCLNSVLILIFPGFLMRLPWD
jgi:hypothetical protein